MTNEVEKTKYPIFDDIEIPEKVIENWQSTVDILAKISDVPAALIMRVHVDEIEVFVSSHSAGNVYHAGEKAPLNNDLYCETVMNTQRELLVPNALKDPLWDKNPDIKLGMISYCGLPVTWPGGRLFGTICILDKQENAYSRLIRDILERFCDSIQFSLTAIYEASLAMHEIAERKQAEAALLESQATLERNLRGTIDVLSGTIEAKGPYAPGHHRHVSALTSAIARELGLTDFQVQGIELASAVYDIGLMTIPIEFLQDSELLDGVKLTLYQGYPKTGHDALKKIEFPWPIAEITLQHRECYDGSGFPQGIRGEEILIEARILAVANAIEDLTTHKSFRNAFPVNEVLEKISAHSGTKYDPAVVAACLRLFKEKGYKMEG
jgi:HD-GYP domain-containing protein (c-di-GMP phosphodiesterase class II)